MLQKLAKVCKNFCKLLQTFSLSFFRETAYNICIKIQQTTVVAVTG